MMARRTGREAYGTFEGGRNILALNDKSTVI